MKNNIHNL